MGIELPPYDPVDALPLKYGLVIFHSDGTTSYVPGSGGDISAEIAAVLSDATDSNAIDERELAEID